MVPVFIGGCERSGTTFLGSLLGGHSQCLTVPESQFKIRMLRHIQPEQPTNLPDVLDRIRDHWRFKLWDIDLTDVPLQAHDYPELLCWLVRQYGARHGRPDPGFWIDHTPANMRYGATLRDLFPDAKFIHLVRDGRAVAASVLPLDWGPNTVLAAAHWWSEGITPGLAAEVGLSATHIVRVRYEDLVRAPEATLTFLCKHIGLDYEPAMAKGRGFEVGSYTAGQHTLVGQAPDPRRLNAWEQELTQRHIEIFESITGDLLRYLDYPLHFGPCATAASGREKVTLLAQEMLGRHITNRLRYFQRARAV